MGTSTSHKASNALNKSLLGPSELASVRGLAGVGSSTTTEKMLIDFIRGYNYYYL
jgi:hypothetical protein